MWLCLALTLDFLMLVIHVVGVAMGVVLRAKHVYFQLFAFVNSVQN